jgi:hypothetical protein
MTVEDAPKKIDRYEHEQICVEESVEGETKGIIPFFSAWYQNVKSSLRFRSQGPIRKQWYLQAHLFLFVNFPFVVRLLEATLPIS